MKPNASSEVTSASHLGNLVVSSIVGLIFACSTVRASDLQADDAWTNQRVEAAFHEVLAHGDLADIDFLAKTLELRLQVSEKKQPAKMQNDTIDTTAIATIVPSYLNPYNLHYSLRRSAATDTAKIELHFAIKSCPDLKIWGKDWDQVVKSSKSMSTDNGPDFDVDSIQWHEDAEGIVLERLAGGNECTFSLTQVRHVAPLLPEPPTRIAGSGTDLLERFVNVVIAGDLRDYRTIGRILHTDMSTDGKTRAGLLYDGSATPAGLIPGTDSGLFMFFVNDTGWIDSSGGLGAARKRGPRIARLWMPVDTTTICISPASLEERLRQKRVSFHKTPDTNYGGDYLRTVQRGNELRIGYSLDRACIEILMIEQTTAFTIPAS